MRERLSSFFLFAMLIWMLYEGARVLAPFLGALVTAIAIGVVFSPLHEWICRELPRAPAGLRAFLSDLFVVIFLVVPLALIVWAVAAEAGDAAAAVKDWIDRLSAWLRADPMKHPWFRHLPAAVRGLLDLHPGRVQERLAQAANATLGSLAHLAPAVAANAFSLLLDIVVFILALFFVFRDGREMVERAEALVPLRRPNRELLREKLHMTIIGVMRGTFLTALVQGLCATAGYLIVGATGALILGLLTGVMTLLPGIGSPAVWVPVCVYYLATGSIWKGGFIAAWGILVVGVVDNLLRPYIVGTKAEIPFVWLFFGLLGGIEVFGALGLILGPLILGIIPVLLEIYRKDFLDEEASAGPSAK